MTDDLRTALEDIEPLMEVGTMAEVIGYLEADKPEPAIEILCINGNLQYACMNAAKGDVFFALTERIIGGERCSLS